ncbi:Ig-like domain-containing protein [Companilactobacillus sp. HBUAS59699]|uniref:Ig-like domain-containing protein n=1 Tax=Companilactobacillus sp. HBUAS59699 TaxID=3109358 RepID=UPI002FF0CD10
MTKLNVYKDSELIGTGESPVHIDLDPATYPAGTFKGELVDGSGNKTDKFDFPEVTVVAPVVPVTKITLDPSTASIKVGDTSKLIANVEPNNATETGVTWSSSDTAITTVSGGTVTGKAAGTSTITATSKSDSEVIGTAEVTVTAAEG